MIVREEHPPLHSDDGYARAFDPAIWTRGQARSRFASELDVSFLAVRTRRAFLRPADEITGIEAWAPCTGDDPRAVRWLVAYRSTQDMRDDEVEDFIDSQIDPGILGIFTRY
jgi:hypothetical protein